MALASNALQYRVVRLVSQRVRAAELRVEVGGVLGYLGDDAALFVQKQKVAPCLPGDRRQDVRNILAVKAVPQERAQMPADEPERQHIGAEKPRHPGGAPCQPEHAAAVAERLGISQKTVANTCTQIKDKLGADSTRALIRIAIDNGLAD